MSQNKSLADTIREQLHDENHFGKSFDFSMYEFAKEFFNKYLAKNITAEKFVKASNSQYKPIALKIDVNTIFDEAKAVTKVSSPYKFYLDFYTTLVMYIRELGFYVHSEDPVAGDPAPWRSVLRDSIYIYIDQVKDYLDGKPATDEAYSELEFESVVYAEPSEFEVLINQMAISLEDVEAALKEKKNGNQ